ncbi:MAG: hypothetical protein BWX71_01929 [Deltaproteobacteria bacterium ADurb.Bin072]|nr:MAG: hypothetical protein BWX71_01929 [Deltaproteobacteria bacterium ADurb.Bin072]
MKGACDARPLTRIPGIRRACISVAIHGSFRSWCCSWKGIQRHCAAGHLSRCGNHSGGRHHLDERRQDSSEVIQRLPHHGGGVESCRLEQSNGGWLERSHDRWRGRGSGGLFGAYASWQRLPAALQHGRQHSRRESGGQGGARGGRSGLPDPDAHDLPHYGSHHGGHRPHRAAVRSRRARQDQDDHQHHLHLHLLVGCDPVPRRGAGYAGDTQGHAHPRGCVSRGIHLSPHTVRGHARILRLQHGFSRAQRSR